MGSGDWYTSGNWTPATVPSSGDTTWIENGGTARISNFPTNGLAQTSTLIVGNTNSGNLLFTGTGSLIVTTTSLGLNSGSTGTILCADSLSSMITNTLTVGGAGIGVVTISSGFISTGNTSLGVTNTGSGTVLLTSSYSVLTAGGSLLVGDSGTGIVTVSNGALVATGNTTIGAATGSTGSVTVTGANSTLSASSNLFVGDAGTGTLTISNGGIVNDARGFIGDSAGSHGTVLLTGTQSGWHTAIDLNIGTDGAGVLTVGSGATLTVDGTLNLASGSGTATLNVGAASSDPAVTAGILHVTTISGGVDGLVQFNHTATASNPYYFTSDGTSNGTPIAVTGNVSVVQTAGYTVLNGNDPYTGATTVNGGTMLINGTLSNTTVTVNSGATLGGSGTVAGLIVQSGALLAVSTNSTTPQTFTVGTISLRNGSNTYMRVNSASSYDRFVVTGGAPADMGGSLKVLLNYGSHDGDTFTIATATSYTNTFSSITNLLGNAIFLTSSVSGNNLNIIANQGSFSSFAVTPNQEAVAGALNSDYHAPGMQNLVGYLNSLPGSSLSSAFDHIAPEEVSALTNFGFSNTRAVFGMLGDRFQEIRNGQQFSSEHFTMWDPSMEFSRNSLLASNDFSPYGAREADPHPALDPKVGVFVSGQGTFGSVNGDNDTDNNGFNFNTGGVILGIDYRITEETCIGLYGGYQGTSANIADNGTVNDDSGKFGVYAMHWWDDFSWLNGSWLSGSLGGGTHSYDIQRVSVGGTASGTPAGEEFNAQAQFGHDFKVQHWTFTPNLQLGYNHMWVDDYTESGSLAPLNIQSQEADSLRSTLGCRVSNTKYVPQFNWIALSYLDLGWEHEYLDNKQAISASFANGSGTLFTVNGPTVSADSTVFGAGEDVRFNDRLSGNLGYSAELNPDYFDQNFSGSLTYHF